jgi:hypothetical protein
LEPETRRIVDVKRLLAEGVLGIAAVHAVLVQPAAPGAERCGRHRKRAVVTIWPAPFTPRRTPPSL